MRTLYLLCSGLLPRKHRNLYLYAISQLCYDYNSLILSSDVCLKAKVTSYRITNFKMCLPLNETSFILGYFVLGPQRGNGSRTLPAELRNCGILDINKYTGRLEL